MKQLFIQKRNKEDKTDELEHDLSLVNEDLVTAFISQYVSVMDERMSQEIYTTDKLRLYFSAYIIPKMPDPLNQYLHRLSDEGFPMQGTSLGVPGIMVRRKIR